MPTRNTLLRGDNLEGLKLLLPELENRIGVIYLDPPYNTGNKLLYSDRHTHVAGRKAGDRHESWLSMMYPRLFLAHRLLRKDGVLFVSIDDREFHHLRCLLDEIFGESNFVGSVTWRKKVVRGRGRRHILPQTEYILAFAKELSCLPPFSEPLSPSMREQYPHSDARGHYKRIPFAKSGTRHSPRPNLVYPVEAPDKTMIDCPTHQWRWSRQTFERRQEEIEIRKNRNGRWTVYTKQYLLQNGAERRKTPESYYDRATTTDGTREMKALFGEVLIDFPKPSRLIRDLISWVSPPGSCDLVMDFFAGSGTTAQAVLDLNRLDGGCRPFVLVQAESPTPYPDFPTIADICQERIQRTLNNQEAAGLSPFPLDIFRILKTSL